MLSLLPSLAYAWPDLAISTGKTGETIELSVPETTPHKVFTLENPDRLVVDVPSTPALSKGIKGVELPDKYKGDLLKSLRGGQFDADTVRFVFTLAQKVAVADVDAKDTALRITIESSVGGGKDENAEAENERETAYPVEKKGKRPLAAQKPDKKQAKKAVKYKKPLIVIDAGHGGVDPGAIGEHGLQEKDVVLTIAKALRSKLLKTDKYLVKLTRDDDRFIMLRKRIAIAREAGASIFISLHADSADDTDARGLSVYTLSDKASDQEAESLAARENKADVLAGVNLSDEREDVADILISLAQRETNNRSAMLADFLTVSLDGKVRLLPNSHRFAGFAVLKAPDVPSVLIETGFLSHPQEEKMLKTKAYREKVVAGIAQGIDRYFQHLAKGE